MLVVLALGAVAVLLYWHSRGEDMVLGIVLTLVAVLGFFVKQGRARWYLVGAACVFVALFIGAAHGPLFDEATTGYCDSVFEPAEAGYLLPDDAPPGTRRVCEVVRQERIPVVGVLMTVGLAGLVISLRKRQVPFQTDEPATSDVH